jgi:hypothetical protein
MTPTLGLLALLLVALASGLLVVSGSRDWRPSLTQALLVAAGLRLAMFVIAHDVAPYDLVNDFRIAGENVLAHQDPTLNSRPRGWNYLPTYGFLLAGMVAVEESTGLPWLWVARVLPITFDLGVTGLVYLLARPEKAGLRAFQYACTPIAIFVSAVHGQMEPLCLLFAVGAFLALRRGPAPRVVLAGVLIALAISVKTWPVLFLPAPAARPADLAGAAAVAHRRRRSRTPAAADHAAPRGDAGRQAAAHRGRARRLQPGRRHLGLERRALRLLPL